MQYISDFDDDSSEVQLSPNKICDLVENFLTFYAKPLSDYLDETDLLSNQVHIILYDAQDEKLARIKDLYDAEITRYSKWVESNYETNSHAKWIFNSSISD